MTIPLNSTKSYGVSLALRLGIPEADSGGLNARLLDRGRGLLGY